jgi:hypothetical protein
MSKMFAPLQLAGLQHPLLTPHQITAAVRLAHIAYAPPDWAGAQVAFTNSIAAIDALMVRSADYAPEAEKLIAELRQVTPQLSATSRAEVRTVMAGRRSKFPVWYCLACIAPDCTPSMLAILGAEIELALRERRQIRTSTIKRIAEFADEAGDPARRDAVEERAHSYLAKLLEELARGLVSPSADPRGMWLNSRILASLAHQCQSPNLADRLAVDPTRTGKLEQITAASRQLRVRLEAGDPTCLSTILGHCCGIGLGLIEHVPFASHCAEDWIARIDVQLGVVQVDLTRIIRGARPKPGHIASSGIVTTHLPMFAAKFLFDLVAVNPQARCVDECCGRGYTARDELPSSEGMSGINAALFVRARGKVALHAGIDRGVAAVTLLDLSVIGPSTLNYDTVRPEEIWHANQRRYAALGWGEPVPLERASRLAVGSAVTPTAETISCIDRVFVDAVESTRPGRRYACAKLVDFHNAFARLCVHRMALFAASRGAEEFGFYADWIGGESDAVFLVDKRVGPHKGRIPLAQPMRMAMQISLWKSHLISLAKRLNKIGHPLVRPLEKRVDGILAGEHVPLFFLLGDRRLEQIGSAQLQTQHPEIKVKPDARRHFMMNALRDEGVPFTLVSAHLRHHIRGLAVTEYRSQGVPVHLLETLAHALDRIGLQHGVHPVPGLRQRGL